MQGLLLRCWNVKTDPVILLFRSLFTFCISFPTITSIREIRLPQPDQIAANIKQNHMHIIKSCGIKNQQKFAAAARKTKNCTIDVEISELTPAIETGNRDCCTTLMKFCLTCAVEFPILNRESWHHYDWHHLISNGR